MKFIITITIILFCAGNLFAAVLIDANTEYISIADDAKWTLTPATSTRTFSMYFYTTTAFTSDGQYEVLAYFNNTSGNKFQITRYRGGSANYIMATVSNSGWTALGYFYCSWTPTLNIWHHLAVVMSTSGNNKIYIDGASQSVSESSWDDTTEINPNLVQVGNGSTTTADFTFAHWAVFSDELSSAEVTAIKNNPYSFDANANIICSMHCDEMTDNTANDIQSVATQTDGTLTNFPTWSNNPVLHAVPVFMHHYQMMRGN